MELMKELDSLLDSEDAVGFQDTGGDESPDEINRDMSSGDVARWLERKGIPSSFCDTFKFKHNFSFSGGWSLQ